MQQIIETLSQRVGSCILFSVVFFIGTFLIGRRLLNALFRMHKSASMVRKLYDQYSFWEKMRLRHVEQHCEHAVKFCRGLLLLYKISVIVFAVYLFAVLLYLIDILSAPVIVSFSFGRILLFDAPVCVIDNALTRPLFARRHKNYSFEKYHNTENHIGIL